MVCLYSYALVVTSAVIPITSTIIIAPITNIPVIPMCFPPVFVILIIPLPLEIIFQHEDVPVCYPTFLDSLYRAGTAL